MSSRFATLRKKCLTSSEEKATGLIQNQRKDQRPDKSRYPTPPPSPVHPQLELLSEFSTPLSPLFSPHTEKQLDSDVEFLLGPNWMQLNFLSYPPEDEFPYDWESTRLEALKELTDYCEVYKCNENWYADIQELFPNWKNNPSVQCRRNLSPVSSKSQQSMVTEDERTLKELPQSVAVSEAEAQSMVAENGRTVEKPSQSVVSEDGRTVEETSQSAVAEDGRKESAPQMTDRKRKRLQEKNANSEKSEYMLRKTAQRQKPKTENEKVERPKRRKKTE